MYDFHDIKVVATSGDVKVDSYPAHYTFIGKGAQGAVFKISDTRCVKIYPSLKNLEREYASYQTLKNSSIVPKLHEKGSNYLVIEYLKGSSLSDYLKRKGILPMWATQQMLYVLKKMGRFQLKRRDFAARHIFLDKNSNAKVIDLVNSLVKDVPIPITLFNDLKHLGFLKVFRQQVKELNHDLYKEWKKSPDFTPNEV